MRKKILCIAGILSILMILTVANALPVAGQTYFNDEECYLSVSGASSYHYAAVWRYTSTTSILARVEASIDLPGWALMADAATSVSKNFWWIFRTSVAWAEVNITAGTGSDFDWASISNDSYDNLKLVATLDVLDYQGSAPYDYCIKWLYQ